ncbi:MAG TPA: kelch repeat-containing protein [Blastocatellia bacterium]|nr:kelch repeat-containing protein [Blastocatellia bacterium]
MGATATLLPSGQVLVVGGASVEEVFNSAELYDPATSKWDITADLNTARNNHMATLLTNGKVLVVGGYHGRSSGYLRSAELYDPEMLDPAPTAPRIIMASVSGKKLFITGENFHDSAVILLNGEEQKTKQLAANPQSTLIGKKAGKKIKPGDHLQVRNPNGTVSQEFLRAKTKRQILRRTKLSSSHSSQTKNNARWLSPQEKGNITKKTTRLLCLALMALAVSSASVARAEVGFRDRLLSNPQKHLGPRRNVALSVKSIR